MLLNEIHQATARSRYQSSEVIGGAFASLPFQDVCNDGVLIGLRVGLGKFFKNDVVKFVQPIYLTPQGKQYGDGFGGAVSDTYDVVAPPGYAVSGLSIRGGGGLDAITMEFSRLDGDCLDTRQKYVTGRIGGPGGGESFVGGDGTPLIGICGRTSEKNEWLGLGAVFLHSTSAAKAEHRWR